MSERDKAGTQSIDRAVGLLRMIAAGQGRGLRLSDLVARSGLARPTAYRLITALERHGLVMHDPDARLYYLGPEAFVIGAVASERFGVHRAALPSLRRLALASQDTAFLSVRRDLHAVCLHREEGPFPIRSHVLQAGDRHPLGIGAGSLAILAALPDDEVARVIEDTAQEVGERYREFTPALMREQVARVRAQGYAFNPGHVQPGSWGVGVAVIDHQGRCAGALSIAAMESRLAPPRREEIAALLRSETQRLLTRLRQSVTPGRRPTGSITRDPTPSGLTITAEAMAS
jgi:DNA-binding IclR family transcriptional regulator